VRGVSALSRVSKPRLDVDGRVADARGDDPDEDLARLEVRGLGDRPVGTGLERGVVRREDGGLLLGGDVVGRLRGDLGRDGDGSGGWGWHG